MDSIFPLTIFITFITILLALDLYIFHKKTKPVSLKEALGWSLFWIALSLSFSFVVYQYRGLEGTLNYLTGYIIEMSLSVDNLFVFILIFDYFQTPKEAMHKVLFWGILGAIVLRALFIAFGIALILTFQWMIYIFGIILIVSGIKLWFEEDKKINPKSNPLLKILKKFIPLTDQYDGDRFFILKKAKWYATPLFAVLILIETSDIIFAVDSIPAILAITYDPFIVFTSNIFAILGLRSLYFVLHLMRGMFQYMNYGLSFILVFIGTKMLLAEYIEIPTWIALSIIFVTLALSAAASSAFSKKEKM
jgi:tellurite resistance protein TerC